MSDVPVTEAPFDMSQVTLARGAMGAASEHRSARAAADAVDGPTPPEAARWIARVVVLAARRLDVPQDGGLREMCRQMVAASRRTIALSPGEYRICYWLAQDDPRSL